MNVTEAVASRRSIRAYLEKPVDREVLERILDKAQRSASGGNTQPWHGIVLTGDPLQRLIDRVAQDVPKGSKAFAPEYHVYPPELDGNYEARRREIGEHMYGALEIPREDKMARLMWFAKNFRAFDAPVLLLVHTPKYMGPPQWSDMGMWLQSVMLLLVEAGLASCPQECWAMYGRTVRQALALGDDQILFTGLAIGYADESAPVNQWPVPRVGLDEVIDWQGF